ncbi:MAG TPA: zinc ABC transporter substrate-binding protein [Campylobacterales bacterium]|nr:zinc ABC transporter substrate-binding protein [Campylobacterales bacterium]HIO71310.1 zinc ABC transporter substrate-binding protein [Campylobacterales bacterium]
MFRNIVILTISILILIVALFVYPFYNPKGEKDSGKLEVAVTIYPIYDIVKNIGRDRVIVHQLIPFGSEPHSFEPTPKNIIEISNSQLFVYTGTIIDRWAEEFTKLSPNSEKFLKASEYVEIVGNDPHFWQSIENMEKLAKTISERLESLSPKDGGFFQVNLSTYLEELEKLKKSYKERLGSCRLHSIIVNHNAFSYLAKDFNISIYHIMGLSPDDRPSAKTLSNIVDIVKEKNISTLFFEELASDNVIRTIAKDTGVQVSSLSPLGNVPPEKVQEGYINLMYENLEKLSKGLDCQ